MKTKRFCQIILLAAITVSCDEPETVLTNFIHPDGSVTRKIEMKNAKNNFKPASVQVPFDSSWVVTDSISIGDTNDTTWFKTAVKEFQTVSEINDSYSNEAGVNRKVPREASFTRKFRWFSTSYRFSEKLEKTLISGYEASKFLNTEEIEWSRLPSSISEQNLAGADSLKYRDLDKATEDHSNRFFWSSVISEWINEFSVLADSAGVTDISTSELKARENQVVDSLISGKDNNDSVLIAMLLGERNFERYRALADSASAVIDRKLERNLSFAEYTTVFVMPGKISRTNGLISSDGSIVWPVRSEFFLSQTYVMWAESVTPNIWAWVISVAFILFVCAGLLLRKNKKG